MEKIWFITGSSRGLGRSLTEAVLATGDKVAATARNIETLNDLVEKYPGQVYPLQLDVTDYAKVPQAVADSVAHFGRIDVLVNNAGFGIVGAAEAFTAEQVRSQLETNLYAPIEISRAVIPYMRRQGSGRILQISSVGGRVGTAGITIYQAAKFGLSGFSEGLAKELAPLGIMVTCVEPGGFRTDWAGESMSYATRMAEYDDTVNKRADLFESGQFIPMGDPDKAAKAMVNLANHPHPPIHLVLGSEAAGMVKQANSIREEEFEKWMPVTLFTDHADAVNFLDTPQGQAIWNVKR